MTSNKGKAKEDAHWQLGWWELFPILDRTLKPVSWSRSSVVFSGHPTQPRVIGHHHNSSKEFTLSSPKAIEADPESYRPPTIISVCPKEELLYAYFPGNKDGVGCVWRRGIQLDAWGVIMQWRYPPGAGSVLCEWTLPNREWFINDAGNAERLPPLGLQLPVTSHILLEVTQSREFNIHLFSPLPRSYRVPLMQRVDVLAPRQDSKPEDSVGGRRVCVAAAIGTSFNDSSMVIATRSHLLPPEDAGADSNAAMDMVLNMDHPTQLSTTQDSPWDAWGEESIIEVSEIWLNKPGLPTMTVSCKPIVSILRPSGHVVDMKFFCTPPEPPGSTSPMATKDPRRQAKEQAEKRGHLYLVANFLKTGDYIMPPSSEVNVYTFGRTGVTSPKWCLQRETLKTFDKAIVAYTIPVPTRTGAFVGLLHTSGSYRRTEPRPQAIPIGTTSVLTIPDLNVDDRWETVPILSPPDSAGRDFPTSYSLSPNGLLLASSPVYPQASISALPRRKFTTLPPPLQGPNNALELGKVLAASVFFRKTPTDIIGILTAKSSPEGLQENALAVAIALVENNSRGLGDIWMHELLGVLVEVARIKQQRATDPTERALLKAHSVTVHDMCSIAVANTAFADCHDGESYDLEAVWQLITLSVWILDFLERIMRDYVSIGDSIDVIKPDSSFLNKNEPACVSLLHLVHRYALDNLYIAVKHVKALRDELISLTPKAENAHVAKELLMDAFSCAGINIDALGQVLGELRDSPAITSISASDIRQSLANFAPIAKLQPNVKDALLKLKNSNSVDRTRLFIKSPDLVDDLSQLSIGDHRKEKEKNIDVVTKGALLHRGAILTCIRCNGKFEITDASVQGNSSLRWRAWERRWAFSCICGGLWTFSGGS